MLTCCCRCQNTAPVKLKAFEGSSTQFVRQRKFKKQGNTLIQQQYQQRQKAGLVNGFFPFAEAWGPTLNNESLAPNFFAFSIFPYAAFLYYLTRSKQAPKLTLFGFYFLLVFVGVTIPAGIYAKTHYETSLSNVDWLHGGAESFLTITNLLIVLGLRQGIREAANQKQEQQQEQDKIEEIAVVSSTVDEKQ
eukprot:TRINITY_DN2813_c0_g1_i1.p1 TRINITY_DN2813_c0_g1~~TRINITY_DN2813_c0_g1_i1.p1  ORF type:complete len:191 (-),score=22.92 TRINITY_DN2813_c0_g1_i1:330-902(-)